MHIHKHNEVPGHDERSHNEIGVCVCVFVFVYLSVSKLCAHLRSYMCVHVYSVLDVEHVCVLCKFARFTWFTLL